MHAQGPVACFRRLALGVSQRATLRGHSRAVAYRPVQFMASISTAILTGKWNFMPAKPPGGGGLILCRSIVGQIGGLVYGAPLACGGQLAPKFAEPAHHVGVVGRVQCGIASVGTTH
jgi:hypothetical protein